jgi:hypothetical protein
MKEKFRKKSKCFGWKILLSSCSLVGLYVNLQVKVTGKKRKFSEYFSGGGLCLTHVGAPCCETWLKFEVKDFRCSEKKMFGSWVTPLVGRHVVNET